MTDAEKLILLMLSEIHKQLKIENGIDAKFVQKAIYSNNTWGLYWRFQGIPFTNANTPDEVREVVDVLDMWTILETSYVHLSLEDKQRVLTDANPFGSNGRFPGFDGNNETDHLNIASFLVEELDRFTQFKGRDMNSHTPNLLVRYKRMLPVFELYRSPQDLNASQIAEILNAALRKG